MSNLNESTFVAHHGSPGTPDDFQFIMESLKDFNWHPADRYNGDKGPGQGSLIQVGYSWGAVEAVKAASSKPEITKAVILISPYLFVSKKMSPVIKTILGLPILGDMMLSKIAPKSIAKMIVDSSSPEEVPLNYQDCEKTFAQPKVLKPALFEKDIPTNIIIYNLKKLKELAIPVIVIRGDSDKTSNEGEQFTKLAENLDYSEVVIRDAGHALPWTHTEGVVDEIKKFLSNFNQ